MTRIIEVVARSINHYDADLWNGGKVVDSTGHNFLPEAPFW
jgi:hypothetical protein